MCECYVPEISECSFLTASEKFVWGLDAFWLASDVKYEENLIDILGEDTVVELRMGGGRTKERKTIPIGEAFGSVIREYNYNKRVYLFGPCIVAGWNLFEEDRLYAQIQNLVESYEYQVVAVTIPHYRFIEWEIFMRTIPVRAKDILLVINNRKWFGATNASAHLDLLPLYNMTNRESMFCGFTLHTGAKGNKLIAEEIMQKYLKRKFDEAIERKSNQYIQKGELVNQTVREEINDYIEKIRKNTIGRTGAIIMNCNPFTNGHRYLIEYAVSSMDWLYVFVVEEDRSLFKFQDRFQMVLQGTSDLANVIVVPSGKWVLSYKTMPCYFEKEEKQDIDVNAKYDLEIFARYIAPPLGIIKRFVGEEPLDKVTQQYNEQMKEILFFFDIGVEEVKRLQLKGKIVSASEVRSCMRDGGGEELKTLVPNSTFKIITEKYS